MKRKFTYAIYIFKIKKIFLSERPGLKWCKIDVINGSNLENKSEALQR